MHDFGQVYGAGNLDLAEVTYGFRAAAARARRRVPGPPGAAEMGDIPQWFGSASRAAEWEWTATGLQREEGLSSVCQYDARRLDDADTALIRASTTRRHPARYVPSRSPSRRQARMPTGG